VAKSRGFGKSSKAKNSSQGRSVQPKPTHPIAAMAEILSAALQHYQAGQLSEAEQLYRQVLQQQSHQPDALHWLGVICYQSGRTEEGLLYLQQAVALKPNDPNLQNSVGAALMEQGTLEQASVHLQQAIVLHPQHFIAHANLGHLLQEQGNLQAAIHHLQQAIALNPNDANAHNNLGNVLREQDQWEKAVVSYQRAISLWESTSDIPHSNQAAAHTNLGNTLRELGQLEAAVLSLHRALTLEPDHAVAHDVLGVALMEQGDLKQAISHLQQAVSLDPGNAETHYNLALALLAIGDFRSGFIEHEWRWHTEKWKPALFSCLLWDGSDLAGKTIMLHAEQGFGDTIQFIRYLPFVKARGGRIVAACQPPLRPLLECIPEIEHLIVPGEDLPEFQVQIPLMSLPWLFETTLETVPASVPYLPVPKRDRLKLELPSGTRLKVGVVWASGQRGTGRLSSRFYEQKSCSLTTCTELLSIPEISFYSLQVGQNANDFVQLNGAYLLQDLSPQINDFADTAALIDQMDLVISVDTAVAHLAGALGKPVWVLLPFASDWRWMRDRQDIPWYPTMRLFRQSQPGDWEGVIDRVAQMLKAVVNGELEPIFELKPTGSVDIPEWIRHNDLGAALQMQGKLEEAASHYRQAIALQPNDARAYANLGRLLRSQGKLEAAIFHLRKAFVLDPNFASIHQSLGLAFLEQGSLELANAHSQQAAALEPNDPNAYYSLGLVLEKQDKLEAAIVSYQRAIALAPNHIMALTNLGNVLQEQGKLEKSIHSLQEALALSPNNAVIHHSLGLALVEQGNWEQAIVHLHRKIALEPEAVSAHCLLGRALWLQGNHTQAIDSYRQAIQLEPDHAETHMDLACALLSMGDFHNGFSEYEWRWQTQQFPPRSLAQPLWNGSSLKGKTILLHHEGGFGDAIQFIRYVSLVSAYEGQIIVECPAALKRLLTEVSGIEQLIVLGEALPEFQVYAPLLSLPHILGTTLETIPAQIPYLTPPASHSFKLEQAPGTRLKVGLVWASGYKTKRNLVKDYQTRSCPLSVFTTLLTVTAISFYSLQVGCNAADIAQLEDNDQIQDLSCQIEDFADTAALIDQMDLVISVDTAVAHLAGALGKPVWVLLPFAADWRWMRDRQDSPWYPTMRLFRQSQPGDWEGVIDRVTEALKLMTFEASNLPATRNQSDLALGLPQLTSSLDKEVNDSQISLLAVNSLVVIIPIFNVIQSRGKDVFLRTLNSIEESIDFFQKNYLHAEQVDFEIVLVDDASTDDTVEVIHEFIKEKYEYRLIKHPKNSGQAAARNTGIRLSKGKAIFFCDQDDLYLEDHIFGAFTALNQSLALGNQSLLDLCKGYPAVVKTQVRLKEQLQPARKVEVENVLVLNLAVRREAAEFIEGFPEDDVFRKDGDEDCAYNYWLSRFFSAVWLDSETVEFIRYPGNTFDQQIEKFQAAPEDYKKLVHEEPSPEEVRKSRVIQEQFEYLQRKLQDSCSEGTTKTSADTLALQHHQAWSERLHRQILRQQPDHHEALHAQDITDHGGRDQEAFTDGQQVAVLNPNDADTHNRLGATLHQQGKLEEAAVQYRQALSCQADNVMALTNLGNLLRSQGKLDEALRHLCTAFTLNPNNPLTHNSLGLVYMEQGNLVMAVAHLRQAIALQELSGNASSPNDADAHYNLGLILKAQDNLEGAVASYQRAIALNPNHVLALQSLADGLRDQDQLDEAISNLRKALTLSPGDLAIHTSLGLTLHEQGNLEEAISYLLQVVELQPNSASAHINLAAVLWTQGKMEAAIASYQTAIQLKPDHAEAHLCLSQCLILIGDLQNGFAEYEWRWKTKHWRTLSFPQPLWDGSLLTGETILLHTEGGFGDIIQFIRYASLVSNRGGRVVVGCPAPIRRLLLTVPGIQQIVAIGEALPEFQVHAPLLSLPHILETTLETVPAQIPYVAAPADSALKLELLPGTQFKVGIAWASGYHPSYAQRKDLLKSYQTRSCSLSLLTQLLSTPGISFYSLQVGHNAADLAQLDKGHSVQDLSPHVQDFADTAALVDQMDLIISVDTAVAHLAGALGKPVWLLLSFAADWRWMREQDDSPWYPTMQLFRQSQPGDWAGVIDRVTEALQAMVTRKLQPILELNSSESDAVRSQDLELEQHSADRLVNQPRQESPMIKSFSANTSQAEISEALALAFHHFQAGQHVEAEQLYRQILRQQPKQPDALHWLGVIVYQSGRVEEGFACLQQAIALQPRDANIHNSLGVALMQSNLEQAAVHFRQAIALQPNHFFAHSNLATVLLNQGNLEAAINQLQQVVVLRPNDADAHNNLGIGLHQQGRLEEAALHYHKAVSLHPDHITALTNLGNLLRSQGNLDEAMRNLRSAFTLNPNEASVHNGLGLGYLEQGNLVMAVAHLQQAVAFKPNDADAHYNLGLALKAQGKLEAAVTSYEQAIALNPGHILALTSLGDLLREQDRFDEAIAYLRQAIALSPGNSAICTTLGLTLHEQGNEAAAATYLRQVVELNPNDAQAHSNLAAVLWTWGKVEEAIASYRTAIQLQPDHAEAHLCLAQCLILTGDLGNGFAEYEWRWQTKDWAPLSFPQPLWDGSPLSGKTILLHTEGGFGDIIQFIRYVPLVSDRGGQVIVSCSTPLRRLFSIIASAEHLIVPETSLPEFQVHAPLLSLPHIFKTTLETVPAQVPYLTASAEPPLRLELLPGTQLKIGVSWASGYNEKRDLFKNYQTRSCPFAEFTRLLSIPGISFYSFQVGHNAADMTQLKGEYSLQDLSPAIQDFADTAALVDQMDLVISVDTAVIHLAGALGKPVWVLLSRPHDWRWLLDRQDTPWYPTMRLFRQPTPGDWVGVVEQVAEALKHWTATSS
jgi:Flp pilus assembly protein TadD/ADP-heptose:LPS heptosyltransferase/glycosyltransferase involved in cell wall biosynthesis